MERLRKLRTERGLLQKDMAAYLGIDRTTYVKYEKGDNEPNNEVLIKLANYFNVSTDYLLGNEHHSNAIFLDEKKIHMIPLFESVSAGFGAQASEMVIDYVPCYIANALEADEYLCIKVCGDSMYPKIENGDIIQVHKQSSIDSGAIAVVLLDNNEGLVKKVEYGDDWIELQSINPMYQTMRFEGKNVTRVSVVGLVKKIIKDI